MLQAIEKKVKQAGAKGEVVAFAGDVRKEEDIKNAIKFTIEKFGNLDVLVSNAGVASLGNITGNLFDDFKHTPEIINARLCSLRYANRGYPQRPRHKFDWIHYFCERGCSEHEGKRDK